MDLETALQQGGWNGSEPIVLVNTLEGPFGPRIVPYGKKDFIRTPRNSVEVEDPEHALAKAVADYDGLQKRIMSDFGDRGDEITLALDEAVMNFANYRNNLDKKALQRLATHPEELKDIQQVNIWPWRSIAHLCFAVNADGPPDYSFDPSTVRLTLYNDDGTLRLEKGGRGHFIMAAYGDFVCYDPDRGLYIYFNLPEEHWLTD